MKKIFIFLMFFCLTFINVKAEGEFVTNITVDGTQVSGFESSKTEYEINVGNKDKVNIVYTYDKDVYQAQGSYGPIDLDFGRNEKTLTLTNKENASETRTYKLILNREDSRSGDNSLASLNVGGNQVVLGNDNEYTVSVDSKLTSVEVKATRANDKASFVDGYGERTGNNAVKLSGETTTIEIKVKAENEQVRTYKINITKKDYKSNDATLKELKIEGIDFNFKANTFEYSLNAKSDVSKVKITATPNSDKANVEYKQEVTLVSGENVIEIKVTAEDTSTKTYKITITKEEEKPIVSDIKIKDVDFTFDPKKYSYTIETDLETLEFDVTLSKESAKYELEGNEKLKNKSVITLKVTDEDKTTTYKFKILNEKETKTEEENDSKTTGNNGDFFEKNEMLVSLIIFGVGIFGTLVAIILKKKK